MTRPFFRQMASVAGVLATGNSADTPPPAGPDGALRGRRCRLPGQPACACRQQRNECVHLRLGGGGRRAGRRGPRPRLHLGLHGGRAARPRGGPRLVEVDESLTLDRLDMKSKITDATKAVVPVHMLNVVCDMVAITALAAEAGIAVVEDACQAFGVRYRGRRVGTLGNAGAYSFSPSKNISSGEGGLVVTNDKRLAARASMFHDVGSYTRAGWAPSDEPLFVGMNLKMSELASAVLLPQLRRVDAELDRVAVRRRAVMEELAQEESIWFSPHHPGLRDRSHGDF